MEQIKNVFKKMQYRNLFYSFRNITYDMHMTIVIETWIRNQGMAKKS